MCTQCDRTTVCLDAPTCCAGKSTCRSTPRRVVARIVWLGCVAVAPVIAGCDATAPMAPRLTVAMQGAAERGSTIRLDVLDGGVPVSANAVSWSVIEGEPVRTLEPGQFELADTGIVTITAHTTSGSTTFTIRVAAPPTIVFDMHDIASSGSLANRDVYRAGLDGRGLVRLTSGAGDNEHPTAARGVVVFTSFRDGYPALYRLGVAGGPEARIAALTMSAQQPALSTDATRLAFIVSDSGSNRVWTSAADGSAASPTPGAFDPASAEDASPAWNATGTTLAFVSTANGSAGLARLDLASGLGTFLTDGSTTDLDPTWSPDGKQLAFSSTRDGDLGLFVMSLATGEVRRLSAQPSMAGEPAWLPDGRLVYTSWSYAADGSIASQLTWIDPSHPDVLHPIPTPAGNPEHAQPVR
jgi:Tol biopolymer transport system component